MGDWLTTVPEDSASEELIQQWNEFVTWDDVADSHEEPKADVLEPESIEAEVSP